MSKEIQIFNNPEFGAVRTMTIDKEPWFVGKDVAEILGYAKPLNALASHVDTDDSLKQGLTDSLGRKQDTIIINESGLYSLIFSSKLPAAKAFKHWVTSEVLPQIRKTGKYGLPKLSPNPHYRTRMIKTAVKDLSETADVIAELFGVKKGMATAAAMKMVGSAYGIDTAPLMPLLPAESTPSYMTPTAIAKRLGILNKKGNPDPKEVNRRLAEAGLQERRDKEWILTDKGKTYGEAKPYTNNGHSGYVINWYDTVLEALPEPVWA